jgi:signal transduction histidine kinase
VELDLPEQPLRLRAARPRFFRAFLDIVRNALQSATPPPPVRISARRRGREIFIAVDDGGPGVPPELRTRVFDDGFTTRPGGSGFGLAFLRQVVERELRGKVSCEDAELGGARFTISIPSPEADP